MRVAAEMEKRQKRCAFALEKWQDEHGLLNNRVDNVSC